MSVLPHLLSTVSIPAVITAIGAAAGPVSRAVLRHRAGSAIFGKRSNNQRRKDGIAIIKELDRDRDPWYFKALPWRKSNDDQS